MHDQIAALIVQVAALFDLTTADLTGDSRTRTVCLARQCAAWVLRSAYPRLTLAEIGQLLGGRDHSTVRYSIDCARAHLRNDPALEQQLRRIAHPPDDPPPPAPSLAPTISHAMRWWIAAGRESFFVPAA